MLGIEVKKIAVQIRAVAAVIFLTFGASLSVAETIIEAWDSIEIPPPPKIFEASVDADKTALLVLDMYTRSCNEEARPSCVGTIAPVRDLLDRARLNEMLVVYAAGPVEFNGPSEPIDVLARLSEERTVRGPADKFFGSNMDVILTSAGIETVIIVGTSADGAVLYTASSAAFRKIRTIIPVDSLSSKNRFSELYTVWHLANTTGTVRRQIVLSRSDLITIQ